MSTSPLRRDVPAPVVSHPLPSGRTVRVLVDAHGERLEVLAPDGGVEVTVTLGPDGPALTMRAVRMDVQGVETLALSAPVVQITAEKTVQIDGGRALSLTAGESRLISTGDTHVRGRFVRINCDDELTSVG